MVIRIGLEIRIPLNLLTEFHLAINHRRRLAITAAKIKTNATAIEIAPNRTRLDVLGR